MDQNFSFDIAQLNARFDPLTVPGKSEEILTWAWEMFGDGADIPLIATSSSFQTQSIPLLHLISQVCPQMPVIFIDTGFHFPETLTYRDELQARLKLNIVVIHPAITQGELLQRYGEALYRRDPDLCCYLNKVEPMQRALVGRRAWISGVRRDQTENRRTMDVLMQQPSGLLKIHPMLNWTQHDIETYRQQHDLPAHPLYEKGYLSIGCLPCTRPVFLSLDPRAGRWAESEKRECGLHLDWNKEKE
ncbi:MAG: phosphoadenylyl-sulfate reductase [Anaerolineae bacterium]|nr:phosphoadenylyl-sulfate reductase [Anaerolineae bacterium]